MKNENDTTCNRNDIKSIKNITKWKYKNEKICVYLI